MSNLDGSACRRSTGGPSFVCRACTYASFAGCSSSVALSSPQSAIMKTVSTLTIPLTYYFSHLAYSDECQPFRGGILPVRNAYGLDLRYANF